MDQLAVGIIGFGRIGAEHAAWLERCALAKPVAVFDATPARQQLAVARGLRTYPSMDALLNDPKINAVLIATPTAMHCQHALAALSAGKHVMIEKPIALDLSESNRIVEHAAAKRLLVSVFHNRRWDIDYLTVEAAIRAGQFGRVINLESRLGQWSSCVGPAAKEWRPGWRNEAAFGGGGLYDWGSHFLDQIWRLMHPAKPIRLFAQLRGNIWTTDCDDLARICIDFDNGAIGLVEINTTTTRPLPRWHIDGSAGSAQSPSSLQFDLHTWAQLSFQSATTDSPPQLLSVVNQGLNQQQIWDQFTAATRGDATPAVTVQSVLPTMSLLDAARQSSRSGKTVMIHDELSWNL